ncbi:hypothetical protein GJR95_19405 [Spirosoma endbachense]|uniref:Uncharacterized protein n=2 Tax=Spirosoma endbachense TaxID=2666025 RepID=A0A6P1VY89_9BACT|nr:hypothetical protein GJR95_19405 [Spirosoma endbachense]
MIAISWQSVAPNALQNSLQLNQLVAIEGKLAESKRKPLFRLLPGGQEDTSRQNSPNPAEILMQTGNVFPQKSQGGSGSPVLRGLKANQVQMHPEFP